MHVGSLNLYPRHRWRWSAAFGSSLAGSHAARKPWHGACCVGDSKRWLRHAAGAPLATRWHSRIARMLHSVRSPFDGRSASRSRLFGKCSSPRHQRGTHTSANTRCSRASTTNCRPIRGSGGADVEVIQPLWQVTPWQPHSQALTCNRKRRFSMASPRKLWHLHFTKQ